MKRFIEQIVRGAIGEGCTVESKGRSEYEVYTPVWFVTKEQLEAIQRELNVVNLYVDGDRISFTVHGVTENSLYHLGGIK